MLDEVRWGPRKHFLLYTMQTFRIHMILMHDQQNPLTMSNYILYERERKIKKSSLLITPVGY